MYCVVKYLIYEVALNNIKKEENKIDKVGKFILILWYYDNHHTKCHLWCIRTQNKLYFKEHSSIKNSNDYLRLNDFHSFSSFLFNMIWLSFAYWLQRLFSNLIFNSFTFIVGEFRQFRQSVVAHSFASHSPTCPAQESLSECFLDSCHIGTLQYSASYWVSVKGLVRVRVRGSEGDDLGLWLGWWFWNERSKVYCLRSMRKIEATEYVTPHIEWLIKYKISINNQLNKYWKQSDDRKIARNLLW